MLTAQQSIKVWVHVHSPLQSCGFSFAMPPGGGALEQQRQQSRQQLSLLQQQHQQLNQQQNQKSLPLNLQA